jgi:serine/threonine protein kinase
VGNDLLAPGQVFTRGQRQFVRAVVNRGENQGLVFTVAQPVAGRYEPRSFHVSAGRHLYLRGVDQKLGLPVEIKCIVRHEVETPARSRDREGIASLLRAARKALEAERRLLVHIRNAGCNAVPHPNDYVFDTNPQLEGPFATEDLDEWRYDDVEMIGSEPYLILKALPGEPLDELLHKAPASRLSEARSLRLLFQVAGVLRVLHQPVAVRPGMTWQLIYQDLKPAQLLVAGLDQVTFLRLDCCQLVNRDSGLKLLPGSSTPGHAAPECARPQPLTPAADVYSAGVLLFQLLSGWEPALHPGVAPDLRLLEGIGRKEVRDLLGRCLASHPADRYADGAALEQALEPLMRAS